MQNNNNSTEFDLDKVDQYVAASVIRKTFGNWEFVQARIVRGLPALVMRKKGRAKQAESETDTAIFVCTNRQRSRWARIGTTPGKSGPIDDFELIDLLESTLCWQELHGLPRLGLAEENAEKFDVSDAMVRFMHFGGISPLQSAKLVSMIMARDSEGIRFFWLEVESMKARLAEQQANVETEAEQPAA